MCALEQRSETEGKGQEVKAGGLGRDLLWGGVECRVECSGQRCRSNEKEAPVSLRNGWSVEWCKCEMQRVRLWRTAGRVWAQR